MGFEFAAGSMAEYSHIIKNAASQFAEVVAERATTKKATGVVVYGRGHWTMNSAAYAAQSLTLPLYVLERGILPNSYIVDREVPFAAVGSRYRSAWNMFRRVEDWESARSHHGLTESRWLLHLKHSAESAGINVCHDGVPEMLVGQCLFDHNCIAAPFKSPVEFVELVLSRNGGVGGKSWLYRPHPLSPEEYPTGSIATVYGPVSVDMADPWERLRTDCVVHTWNSTLGLEAALIFKRIVNILDPECHYRWVQKYTEMDKRMFIAFLNEISLLV